MIDKPIFISILFLEKSFGLVDGVDEDNEEEKERRR